MVRLQCYTMLLLAFLLPPLSVRLVYAYSTS